ncbi:response regulator [Deinococcus navajonensis]|uniref:Response regulator n=1 Tax=Deinococcus navajonensis TaxID=309884 RepID=A0ABV8XN55_9DEIO
MPIPCHYLLVDDNAADLLLAEEAFGQLAPDCTLTCLSSGEEALQLLRTETFQPDVVLLDINMPVMSGFQVLEAMKADSKLRKIPVVMLSTSSASGDITEAYSLHASSYLVKSSGFSAFLEQIDVFLRYWRGVQVTGAH